MNSLIHDEFPLHETQSIRYELLDILTDDDLNYKLPGKNLRLRDLLIENENVQHAYIQSFKTFVMDWSLTGERDQTASTIDHFRFRYRQLDDEFATVIGAFSEEELHSRTIDRGSWSPSAFVQFHIYREALLIFFAKAIIYLRALEKPLSEKWRIMIG
jgi:hypothetical protein